MRKIVLLLTFFTGFSGLVFQVVWQKYLSLFLGGDALASVIVVSVFLGGLAVGYWAFGAASRGKSTGSLVKMAGLAELGIGVWAFLFPSLFELLWAQLASLPTAPGARLATEIAICILLLAPATIAMGSTLPLLTKALSDADDDLSRVHASVYGINALGAFLGSLLAGFALIPIWGLPLSLMYMSFFNLAAGFIILLFGARIATEETEAAEHAPSLPKPESWDKSEKQAVAGSLSSVPLMILMLSFLAGFVSIGFEIAFIRLFSLALGTSEYSYSVVVGVFIAMISFGAISLRRNQFKPRQPLVNQLLLCSSLVLTFLTVPYWGWAAFAVRRSLTDLPSNFYVYHAIIFSTFAVIASIPAFFMGRSMPLLFSILRSDREGSATKVGWIYAANTIGCCLGGPIIGYVLLLKFNAHVAFRVGIALAAVSLVPLYFLLVKDQRSPSSPSTFAGFVGWSRRFVGPWPATVLAAVVVAVAVLLPSWPETYLTAGLFRPRAWIQIPLNWPGPFMREALNRREVSFYRDDPNTSVAVLKFTGPTERESSVSLMVNAKPDGSTKGNDRMTNLLAGHLPALFASEGDAALIGLGLGATARVLAGYPNVKSLEVFELSQAVIDAQPYFAELNHGTERSPKVTIHRRDAYRGMVGSNRKYSIVVSEPSNPWVSGVDRLYAKEFYEIVKEKIVEGGVFVQWMHTYELSPATFGMVARTFSESFPCVRAFSSGYDVIMLGSRAPLTPARQEVAEQRWALGLAEKDLAEFEMKSLFDLAAQESWFPFEAAGKYRSHSLFFPKLAYAAGRDFFVGSAFFLRDIAFSDPAFGYYLKLKGGKSWAKAMLRSDRSLVRDLARGCRFSETPRFAQLSSVCKSWAIWLAMTGVGDSVGYGEGAPEILAYLRSSLPSEALSARAVASVTKGTSLYDKVAAWTHYPEDLPAPGREVFESLAAGCENEKEKNVCLVEIGKLSVRFGQFDQAKEILDKLRVADQQRSGLELFRLFEQALEFKAAVKASLSAAL